MHPKIRLPQVTLIGVDCVDFNRLLLAAEISTRGIDFGAVKLLSSKPRQCRFKSHLIEHIASIESYSRFMIADLPGYVDTSFALVFQHDGFVLNPAAWDDRFLAYDYIGAPWPEAFNPGDPRNEPSGGPYRLQNGGFSLRSSRLMNLCADLLRRGELDRTHPEDLVICADAAARLNARGSPSQGRVRFAPVEVAARFSREGWYSGSMKWRGQFGFHNFKITDISQWHDVHPDVALPGAIRVRRPSLQDIRHPKLFARQLYDWLW